jgi:hypothetical protein
MTSELTLKHKRTLYESLISEAKTIIDRYACQESINDLKSCYSVFELKTNTLWHLSCLDALRNIAGHKSYQDMLTIVGFSFMFIGDEIN